MGGRVGVEGRYGRKDKGPHGRRNDLGMHRRFLLGVGVDHFPGERSATIAQAPALWQVTPRLPTTMDNSCGLVTIASDTLGAWLPFF